MCEFRIITLPPIEHLPLITVSNERKQEVPIVLLAIKVTLQNEHRLSIYGRFYAAQESLH